MAEKKTLWNRYKSYYFWDQKASFGLDISRMNFEHDFFVQSEEKIKRALGAMNGLEKGEIANPDEKRMVGHYWLRAPELAPTEEIRKQIQNTLVKIKHFINGVHEGQIAPERGGKFKHVLIIGIGGSALGPQFVNEALRSSRDPINAYFFDNTDPDGMEQVIADIPDLSKTLCIVISKSGGTKETRNGQLIAKHAWEAAGLSFAKAFVAVTGEGSELDTTAVSEKWLERFPMWDWVGGRTSELSAVGLLPAALQGFNIDEMLRGAHEMDELTRSEDYQKNPAILLSLMWYHAGGGKGLKDMVVLPYKDRIELFSRYLQQLVMESIGKEKDLDGRTVNQGIAVYGNKGSTDQHAYVQQLRDGLNNFFAVFVEVLKDKCKKTEVRNISKEVSGNSFVEPGITSGDYLSGFLQGTRAALYDNARESMTITIGEVSEYSIGQLIALFERAVGYYASFVNVNAYHQPGVEAGKKAAAKVLEVQKKVCSFLKGHGRDASAEEIADNIGESENVEMVFKIVRHLEANGRLKAQGGGSIFEDRYKF